MNNIEGTTIEEVLGQGVIKKLKKNKSVGLSKNYKIVLKTQCTFSDKWILILFWEFMLMKRC